MPTLLQPSDVGIGQLFERIADAVIVGNADDGRIVLWNPAAERMFGYRAAEVVGQEIDLIIPERQRAAHRAGLRRYCSGVRKVADAGVTLELPALRRDGREFMIELSLTSLEPVGGRPHLVLALLRDVTERTRLRAEQAARVEAEAAGRRMAFLAEASTLLAASLDYEVTFRSLTRLVVPELADWCTVDILDDEAAPHTIAAAHADPAKEPVLHEFKRRYPPDRTGSRPIDRTLSTGQPLLIPRTEAVPIVASNRDPEEVRLRQTVGFATLMLVPLQARGRLLGVITFAADAEREPYTQADLTLASELARHAALAVDNARLYRQAQAAAAEARRAVQVRDEFLSVAAHELKTPLTSLRGFAQLLVRQVSRGAMPDATLLHRGMDVIANQSGRLAHLVDQLLDVTRIEAGRLALRPAPTDLAVLVRATVGQMSAALESAGQEVALLVETPDTCLAEVDAWRFEQVLRNLVDNAFKYGPEHGPVEVRLEPCVEGRARLTVADHGAGIPPELRDRIFDPYYQAHTHEHASGLGLGLFISRQIIELHGGAITAAFPPEGGTRIIITLPLTET